MNTLFKKYLGSLGLVACSLAVAENSIVNSNFNNPVNELFLIDTSIDNYQGLIFDIRSSQNKDIQIIAINPSDTPLSKISSEIKKYQGLGEIHLISHGNSGAVLFGNKTIDQDYVSQHTKQLSSWSNSLKEDGKILLYGCDISKGEKGKRFINTLAGLTGADIHASNNKSGMQKQGQDWLLEDSTNGSQYATLISNTGNNKFTKSLELFSGSAFLYAENVIAGISPEGTFGSRIAAPDSSDLTTNKFIGSTIGYISDPSRNNFNDTYDGDFFVPVIPEEGWAVRVNNRTYNNNRSFQTRVDVPGSLSNFQKKDRFSSVDWDGEIDSLKITQVFRTYQKGLGIIVDVTLENTSSVDMDDVFYMRTVDPDNNAFNLPNPTGSSITDNIIAHQGGNGFGSAVSATQNRGGLSGHSVVTLSGYSEKSRVSFSSRDVDSGGLSRDPRQVFNGTGNQVTEGALTIDSPISLALKFEKIKPGEQVRFRWAYALAEIDFPEIKLDDNGSSGLGNGSYKQVYLLGTTGLPIADEDITIEGTTADELQGVYVKITNPSIGDKIQIISSLPAGISIDTDETNDDFELSFKGKATKEKYIELIQSVRFENQDIGANLATREIIVQVLDEEFNLSNSIDAQVFMTTPLLIDQPISGDDFLNEKELTADLPILGTTAPSAELILTLTDKNLNEVIKTTTLGDDKSWEIKLSPSELATFEDGLIEIAGSSEDIFGNITTGRAEFTKDSGMFLLVDNPANESTITANEYVIEGPTDPHSTVVITLPNGKEFTTTADSQGKWSIIIDDVEDEFNKTFEVEIKATDPAKNTKTETLTLKTPPHPVAFTDLDEDSNGITNSPRPTISGTSIPDTRITVLVSTPTGDETCSTTTGNTGRWSCQLPTLRSGGPYPITVESEASSGAIATASEELTVAALEIDITEPVRNATISPNKPLVVGKSDPNAKIVVTTRGGNSCKVTADNSGNWSCKLSTLVKGEDYQFKAVATDAADNEATDVTNVTVSNLPLSVSSPSFGELVDNDMPIITGTTDPDVEITVTTEFGKVCKTVSDTNGNWACPLEQMPVGGPHDLLVEANDPDRKIDSSVPWKLSIPNVGLTVTSPPFESVVEDDTPVIRGKTDPDVEITVTTEFGKVCRTVADANGDWACPLEQMPVGGAHDLTIAAKDLDRDIERIIPWKLSILDVPLAVTFPAFEGVTDDNTPVITGKSDPEVEVTVTTEFGKVCKTVSDVNGNWSCPLERMPIGGPYDLMIESKDLDRNIDKKLPWKLAIPNVPLVVSEPSEGESIPGNPLIVKGSTNPNSDVLVKGVNGQECVTTADAAGDWTCELDGLNAGDDQPITVTSIKDGLEQEVIRKVNIAIPLLVTEPDEGETITNADQIVTGTTDPNSTVTVKGPDGQECVATSNDKGEWSCQLEGLLTGTDEILTITSTNQNGNVKEVIRKINILIDDGRVETILKGGGAFNPYYLFFYFLIFLRKRINKGYFLKKK